MKKLGVLLLILVLALAGCQTGKGNESKEGKEDLKKVTVVLDWTPNTNHTGLYVAQEKGYFKEAGLEVEIVQPGEAGANQLVASGKAEFGVSNQETITEARVQGVPLVSVAAIIQHNTSGFASLKEKNITSPKDFEGKTYGGWGAPVEKAVLTALMKEDNASIDKLSIVNAGDTDFFAMMEQDVDFAWIYQAWTGIEAEIRNVPINMVYLTDYSKDLDYYTPVLATNEKMIKEDPETVKGFVQAAAKGYEFAIKNPDEAASILLKAEPELSEELVRKSQAWLADQYQAEAEQWGIQKEEVWANYANWMQENGLLEGDFDPSKAYTNEFLK